MNRKLLIGLGIVGVIVYIARSSSKKLLNNIIAGKPKVKSFFVNSGNDVFRVTSLSDFITSISSIFQGIRFVDILQGNFPRLGFMFDLEIPVENKNTIDIPNNSYTGQVRLDGQVIGQVNIPNQDLAQQSITIMSTRVNTSIENAFQLVKRIVENPRIISNGVDFSGTFTSNGVSVPYSFNAKLF